MAGRWDIDLWDSAEFDAVPGGQQAAFSQGTLSPNVTIALTGIEIVSSQGVFSTGEPHGQQANFAQGNVLPNISIALTGSAMTAEQGSFAVRNNPTTLSGLAITTGQGVMTAGGTDVTVHISGVEATFVQGVMSPLSALAGQAIGVGQGVMSPSVTVALTGQEMVCGQGDLGTGQDADDTYITSAQGVLTPNITVALSGLEMVAGQGVFAISGDITLALTGSEMVAGQGTLGVTVTKQLVGIEAGWSQQSMGAPGGASLTGIEMTMLQGTLFVTNDREYPLTGIEMTMGQGSVFASSLAFLAGQEMVMEQQGIGPRTAALLGIEMVAGQGTLTVPSRAGMQFPVGIGGGKRKKGSSAHKGDEWRDDAVRSKEKTWADIEEDLQALADGKPVKAAPVPAPVDTASRQPDAPAPDAPKPQPVKSKAEEEEEDWLLLG